MKTVAIVAAAAALLAVPAFAAEPVVPQASQDAAAQAVDATCLTPAENAAFEKVSLTRRKEVLTCANKELVRVLGAGLPTRVDEITVLDRVTAEGPVVTYHYTVDVDLAAVPAEGPAQLAETIRAQVCANPGTKSIVGYGGAYRYVWVDRSGKTINDLTVDRC
jgi:hypothetical protein